MLPRLKEHLGIPIIRSSQLHKPPPYPYVTYTITSPRLPNRGSYGIIPGSDDPNDELSRLYFKQIKFVVSFTVAALDQDAAYHYSALAYEWFELDGVAFLRDHNIGVVRLEPMTARDNALTIETEYRHGFDVRLSTIDFAQRDHEDFIQSIELKE